MTAAGGNDRLQPESLLVLRNTGQTACLLPPLPLGMFPGPVLVTVPPGGGAAVRLRWSASGDAGDNRCIRPVRITLRLPDGAVSAPFHGVMCAPEGAGGWFYPAPLRGLE